MENESLIDRYDKLCREREKEAADIMADIQRTLPLDKRQGAPQVSSQHKKRDYRSRAESRYPDLSYYERQPQGGYANYPEEVQEVFQNLR